MTIQNEEYNNKKEKLEKMKAKIEKLEAHISKLEENFQQEKDICEKHQKTIRLKIGPLKKGLKKFRYYVKMIECNQ